MSQTARANLRNVSQFVALRKEFVCSNLKGTHNNTKGVGILPHGYHTEFHAAQDEPDFYVVYSYDTPIAWFANYTWYVPNKRYSPSTGRHQSALNLVRDDKVWSDQTRRWTYNGG